MLKMTMYETTSIKQQLHIW